MLDETDFVLWCQQQNLSNEAVSAIRHIRSSPPSRNVGGGQSNVSGRYPSRKMGFGIQFESHTVEFPLVLSLERDDDVLEFYCQPPKIELKYLSAGGRSVAAQHTPDYFVLRRSGAGWIEAKSAEDLPLLTEKYPGRYQREKERWVCPPGEVYGATLGLSYKLHSSADVSATFMRNAQFLDDYLRTNDIVSSESVDVVRRSLQDGSTAMLSDLIFETNDLVSRDHIYEMIAKSLIYVDLDAALLIEPSRVRVFSDSETAVHFAAGSVTSQLPMGAPKLSQGSSLSWDGKVWLVANLGVSKVSLIADDERFVDIPLMRFDELVRSGAIQIRASKEQSVEHAEVSKRLREASQKDLVIANTRMKLVGEYLEQWSPRPNDPPERTVRRYVSLFQRAKEAYGNGYVGLLPQTKRRGNRLSRLPEDVQSAMVESIAEDYERLQQPSRFASWSLLRQRCELENKVAPHYSTYCLAIKARPKHNQVLRRQGRRSAYKHEPFYWSLDCKTSRHGDRPFELAHIDHTQLDIALTFAETALQPEKPWLSIMTDAFSRRVLAAYITFDEPSNRSCMMLLRDCVRRHSRLPQSIVMDGGPEFKSTFFETVLARYECTKKTRPPAKPRNGSVCERMFGTTNTQFIHTLVGNTQILKNVRQVTKSNNPFNHALWNLGALSARLDDYLFQVYDTLRHPALGCSPREAFIEGLSATGCRSQRHIVYDLDFQMLTAPSTRKGTAKVFPGQGVTINYFSYWCEAFRDPGLQKTPIPVRYDPYDVSLAWAFVHNRWVECHSQHYTKMRGLSEKQVKIAAETIRRQSLHSSRARMTVNAKSIAAFLTSVERDEMLLRQQLRDRESREVRLSVCEQQLKSCDERDVAIEDEAFRSGELSKSVLEFELYGAL